MENVPGGSGGSTEDIEGGTEALVYESCGDESCGDGNR